MLRSAAKPRVSKHRPPGCRNSRAISSFETPAFAALRRAPQSV
jgi:hypothetical protein